MLVSDLDIGLAVGAISWVKIWRTYYFCS